MLLLKAIVIALGLAFTSSSTLDLLREACPYSNFCTFNSTKPYTRSNDTVPCCYDCFCDEHCSLFGDCCPDVEQNSNKVSPVQLECKPAGSKPLTERNHYFLLPNYRYIDFCPDGYYNDNPTLIDKCKGVQGEGRQLEDLVIVSDEYGRLFRNKHCAVCHGAMNTTNWDLALQYCQDDIDTMHLTLSQTLQYLLKRCTLVPARPLGVPVTARTMECTTSDHQCSTKEDGMADGCINGPYMPFIETYEIGSWYVFHRNALCYKCSKSRQELEFCPFLNIQQNRMTDTSYRLLLKKDLPKPDLSRKRCDESETSDPHTGACRRLYCQPFQVVSHGKCIPLSNDVSDFLLAVNVIYTLTDDSREVTLEKINMYDESVVQYYLRRISTKYRYRHCEIMKIVTIIHTRKTSKKFIRLLLKIIYKVTPQCSIKFIGERIQHKSKIAEKEAWLLINETFEMTGQFTFYQDPPLYGDPYYNEHLLMIYSLVPAKIEPITTFFVCPYFKLTLKEYMEHVKSLDKADKEYGLWYFAPDSRCLEGFYPLKQNEVAACLQNYRTKNDGPNISLDLIKPLSALLIAYLWWVDDRF